MENITGFIVDVRTKGQKQVSYQYGNGLKVLYPGEVFVGYFWQMTDRQEDGSFVKAHIHETVLIDPEDKKYRYGEEAVFQIDDIRISIRALRGPDRNNRHLPAKFRKYETWNRQAE